MHETCLIIIHPAGMRPGPEPGTFGLADECSTIELTLLLKYIVVYILETYIYNLEIRKQESEYVQI